MRYPSPDDLKQAPLWENYAMAQVVQASLGLIPASVLALGVEVIGARLRVVAQVAEPSASDLEGLDDIRTILEDLVGPEVEVEFETERVEERRVSPFDGVCWIYLSSIGE